MLCVSSFVSKCPKSRTRKRHQTVHKQAACAPSRRSNSSYYWLSHGTANHPPHVVADAIRAAPQRDRRHQEQNRNRRREVEHPPQEPPHGWRWYLGSPCHAASPRHRLLPRPPVLPRLPGCRHVRPCSGQERSRETFSVEVPSADEDWQIGLIVGPSGSGKSTIAREAFGPDVYQAGEWDATRAVIDGFGQLPVKQVTQALTAVGFSSPPGWVKPYAVLSNGEKFRCDLVRALLAGRRLVVFDEFTSVVDRTVARVGSAAVSRAIRSGRIDRKFVAVSCHYDIAEWLEPDWVVSIWPTGSGWQGGGFVGPQIQIELFRCRGPAWRLFARHHYLNARLHPAAQCYLAMWEGQPAAFCAVLPLTGRDRPRPRLAHRGSARLPGPGGRRQGARCGCSGSAGRWAGG